MKRFAKSTALFALTIMASLASAANITIAEPVSGDFLGRNNSVSVNMTGVTVKVEVVITATSDNNPAINVVRRQDFTPNVQNQASGTIPLNFPENQLNGPYTIKVQTNSTSDTFNVVPDIPVTVDVTAPKFRNFNPIAGMFVRDIISIVADFIEDNIDEWKVTVNGADIPSNSGSTNTASVTWDTNGITVDGAQTIAINIKDKAKNQANENITVTLDRRQPVSQILSPVSTQEYRPGARVPVIVEITDQFANAVDAETIDVTIETTTGNFVARVAMINAQASGTKVTWTGRIRDARNVPSVFVIRVKARDKAGNVGNDQTVTINTTRTVNEVEQETPNTPPPTSVKTAATLAYTRGGLNLWNKRQFTRSQRQVFGRGYN